MSKKIHERIDLRIEKKYALPHSEWQFIENALSKTHIYNAVNIEDSPENPGIYIIWYSFRGHRPIYVGQSIKIKRRLREHLIDADNSCVQYWVSSSPRGLLFSYSDISVISRRLAVKRFLNMCESFLISQLEPLCNERIG